MSNSPEVHDAVAAATLTLEDVRRIAEDKNSSRDERSTAFDWCTEQIGLHEGRIDALKMKAEKCTDKIQRRQYLLDVEDARIEKEELDSLYERLRSAIALENAEREAKLLGRKLAKSPRRLESFKTGLSELPAELYRRGNAKRTRAAWSHREMVDFKALKQLMITGKATLTDAEIDSILETAFPLTMLTIRATGKADEFLTIFRDAVRKYEPEPSSTDEAPASVVPESTI